MCQGNRLDNKPRRLLQFVPGFGMADAIRRHIHACSASHFISSSVK
jgi:hypothetical protein